MSVDQARFDACTHDRVVDPPPGKHLRVCLDCMCRLVECSHCDEETLAQPDIAHAGWRSSGCTIDGTDGTAITLTTYACPAHA